MAALAAASVAEPAAHSAIAHAATAPTFTTTTIASTAATFAAVTAPAPASAIASARVLLQSLPRRPRAALVRRLAACAVLRGAAESVRLCWLLHRPLATTSAATRSAASASSCAVPAVSARSTAASTEPAATTPAAVTGHAEATLPATASWPAVRLHELPERRQSCGLAVLLQAPG